MAEKTEDGGPAFPVLPPVDAEGRVAWSFPYPASGLTKRQHFAGLAMQALMSLPPDTLLAEAQREGVTTVGQYIRDQAYAMADLMLNHENPNV